MSSAPPYVLAQASASALPLRDQSVQCVVTSPPYWGLRQYAGEQREVWGGDAEHAHEWVVIRATGGAGVQGGTPQRGGRQNVEAHLFNRRVNVSLRVWQERPGECGQCGFRDTREKGHICG